MSSSFRLLIVSLLVLLAASAPVRAGDGAPPLQWVGGGQYDMSGLDVTPDGSLLVTSSLTDETIKVWNTADGGFVRTLVGDIAGLNGVALSPDGSQVIAGGSIAFGSGISPVKIWDVASGDLTQQLLPADNEVFGVDWSPNGDLVAAGDQAGTIHIWTVADGQLVKTLTVPGFASCFAVAFSPDGTRIAAGYGDNKGRIWNVSTGALQLTLTGHTFFVDAVAWAPDGARVATGSWDNSIRTWNAATGVQEHVLNGHTDIVRSVSFSPDGATLASGSWDHSIRLWNAATGAFIKSFTHPDPGNVNALRYTADGARLAAGGIGAGGEVLNAGTGALLARVGHHRGSVGAVTVSEDLSRLASGAADFDCRVWDATTGQDLLTFGGHNDVINAIDLSHDATLAASGSGSPPPDTLDFSVRLWNPVTGEQLHVLFGHVGGTTGVELTPDEQTVITAGRDGLVKHWSVSTGSQLSSFSSTVGSVSDMDLSPDGTRLAVGGGSVHVLNADTGALLATLAVPGGNFVSDVCWSANGTRVLVGVEGFGSNLHLFDAASGALLKSFSGDPDGFVQAVALSPDGHTAACGSGFSRTIRTFSVDNGAALKLWDKEAGWGPFPDSALAYLSDGRLAYGRADATVVMSNCPGHITAYGAGCAGSGGFVPTLGVSGCATKGGAITISIGDALGGATAFMLFGLGQGSAPLKGCTLLVDPLLAPFVALGLPGSGAGAGALALPAVLPPSMPEIVFTMQAWVKDAGAPQGWATTNGVQVSVE